MEWLAWGGWRWALAALVATEALWAWRAWPTVLRGPARKTSRNTWIGAGVSLTGLALAVGTAAAIGVVRRSMASGLAPPSVVPPVLGAMCVMTTAVGLTFVCAAAARHHSLQEKRSDAGPG